MEGLTNMNQEIKEKIQYIQGMMSTFACFIDRKEFDAFQSISEEFYFLCNKLLNDDEKKMRADKIISEAYAQCCSLHAGDYEECKD